jgi:hypothetical protein
LFAGLGGTGNALSDLWYVDVDGAILFQRVNVVVAGKSTVSFNTSQFLSIIARVPGCNSLSVNRYGSAVLSTTSLGVIRVFDVVLVALDFSSCLLPLAVVPNLFLALSASTTFAGCNISVDFSTIRTEIYFNSTQYTAATPDDCAHQKPGLSNQDS